MNTTYSGYTNYATWSVPLWIDNEESLYRAKINWLESQCREAPDADAIKEFCESLFPCDTPDTKGNDWEGGRWQDVDWQDIAENWEEEWKEIHEGTLA